MENVLETVTIPAHPVIKELKDKMLALGAAASLMSGSGPTVFGIFPPDQTQEARTAFQEFQKDTRARQTFLVRPINH